MKTMNGIISGLNLAEPKIQEKKTTELDVFTRKIINKLFLTFEGIFPAFDRNYGSPAAYDNAKREWTKAFIAEGINDLNKIKIVCEQCRRLESAFMLSIGKFIAMYRDINAYEKKYPMLDTKRIESQKAQPGIVEAEMKKIREMLS